MGMTPYVADGVMSDCRLLSLGVQLQDVSGVAWLIASISLTTMVMMTTMMIRMIIIVLIIIKNGKILPNI